MKDLINLTTDQTNWLLAFFTVVSGLLVAYALNLANGMDTFKKEKKDVRNAIKNSIEYQSVLPIIVNVFTILFSKLNLKEEFKEGGINEGNVEEKFKEKLEELEEIINAKETWAKLDSEIRSLEDKAKELSEVDRVFDRYISYSSYFSKILFPLTFIVAAIIPVYLFGDLLAWVLWLVALVQVAIISCAIKWKALRACSKFDAYEDSYVREHR